MDPRLYEEFLEDFALKKKKHMLEKLVSDENIIRKNVLHIKNQTFK